MKNSNLGAVVILGGIAMIGFTWFRRNKPTTANKQLADLTAQSNALNVGSLENIDKPFEYSQETIDNQGQNPYSSSILSPAEQQQVNQNVRENIDCGLGLAWSTGTDCTNYNIQHQQSANPNNVVTSGCNPPKLLITNVKRFNAGFPTPKDSGSLWSVYYKICGADISQLLPISWKITIIDSVGSQELVVDKHYFVFDSLGGNLSRKPKTAVITLSITDNKGKNYIQTFNYKE
jgi:hypothetical protein